MRQSALSSLGLAAIAVSVVALYALALVGGGSPLSAYLHGQPIGLEISFSDDDLASASRLDVAFGRMGYRLEEVAGGREVPPVFLPAMPADLAALPNSDDKKRVFLRLMLPLVLVVDEEVAADRRRLQSILDRRARNHYVDRADEDWAATLAQDYDVALGDYAGLLKRVDVVPPSLALAQAAEESGWGTSRFTLEANNLFGHISVDENGVIPVGDAAGPRLANFSSLHEAVKAYVHNLNTHRAYEGLRRARAAARARGAFPDGHTLAGALSSYSERGMAYVDTIRALIRSNGLLRFDHARLGVGRGRSALAKGRTIALAK